MLKPLRNYSRSGRRRALGLALTVLVGLSMGVTALAQPTPATTLVVAMPVDFVSFDPNTVPSQTTTNVAHNVIETLVTRDGSPLLATSWEMLDDVTWEFNLRQGVSFSNGEAFDADAVRFSILRIMDDSNENSSNLGQFKDVVADVQVIDPATIHLVTTRPYPELINLLRSAFILPPVASSDPTFSSHGIGTGPYVVSSWSPGEAMILTRNDAYWGGAPFFEEVRFRPVPDAAVRTTELRTHNADIITQVPIEELGRLDEAGITILRVAGTQAIRVHLNAGKPPFDDVRVRQAINYAVDTEEILDALLEGAGRLMASPFGPNIFGFDPDLEPYPYDPAKSRELLAEAGYPDGVDITLQITDGRYLRDRAIGEVLAAQLAEGGFRAEMNYSEFSQWLKLFNTVGNGFMVVAQEDTVTNLIGPNFYSGNESYQRYNYANPEVDALALEAASTLDEGARRALYQQLSRLLHDDAPWLFMWNIEDIYATSSDIKGFHPDGVGYFYVKDLSRE